MPTTNYGLLVCSFILLIIVVSANNTTNCNSTSYLNISNLCELCSSILDFCENCTSSPTCLGCQKGYFLNASSQCQPCNSYVSNCASCTAADKCSSCTNPAKGVKTTVTPNVCQLCSITLPHCATCNNISSCTSCVADPTIYLNINLTVNGECTFCNDTYVYCVTCTPVVCTSCINSTNITLYNGSCVLCSIPIPNCLYCDSYKHCISCSNVLLTLIYENGAQICKLCAEVMPGCATCVNYTHCTFCAIGTVVKNGCSDVAGCIQSYTIGYKKSICLTCRTPEFSYIAQGGVCKCTNGYLTGNVCTFLLGCTQTNSLNSSQCIVCSQRNRFQLVNGSCQCIKTFYQSGDKCMEKCGDGFLYDLACDDGNLIDGDGCSSSCTIQPSFICKQGTPYTASKCYYKHSVCLSLTSINKISNKNSFIIILTFNPYTKVVDRLNYSSSLTFTSNAPCNLTSISTSDANLILAVDYYQNVYASQQANVLLSFDQDIIASQPCFVSFNLEESNGVELMYQQQLSQHSATIQTYGSYLAIFAVLLFLIGNFAHKMIGLQTLHTIQLVFLILVCSPNFRTNFLNFKVLLPAIGQFKSFISAQTNKSNLMYYLQFYVPYSRSYAVIGIVQFIAFVMVIIVSVKQNNLKVQLSKSQQYKEKKIIAHQLNDVMWYRQLMVESFFFPIFIGFFFHFRLLLLNSYYNHYEKSVIQTGGLACYCIINYIVFFIFVKKNLLAQQPGNKEILLEKPYSKCSNQYVLNYLVFIVLTITAIQVQLLFPLTYFNYIMACILLAKIFALLTLHPYKKLLHNISIIFNLTTVIFALAWSMLDKYKLITSSLSIIFQFMMISLLALVELLCIIRIVVCFREHYVYSLSQKDRKKKGSKRTKKVDEENDAYFQQFNKTTLTTNILERIALQATANINILNINENISKGNFKKYKKIFMNQRKNSNEMQ